MNNKQTNSSEPLAVGNPAVGDHYTAPPPPAPVPSSPCVGFVCENRSDLYCSPMTGYPTGGGVYRYFAVNVGRWKFRVGFTPPLNEWHKRFYVVLPAWDSRLPGIQVRLWRFAVAFAWENTDYPDRVSE